MHTTLLERPDPALQLRPRPVRTTGIGHTVLAELDRIESTENPGWKPVTGPRERVRRVLGALKRPEVETKPNEASAAPSRPAPRAWRYPVTMNLPTPGAKPKPPPARTLRVRPMLHRTGRWAVNQMPPIPLLWKPMLKRVGPNALADDMWRAFWGHWDAFIDLTHRSLRDRLELLRRGADIRVDKTCQKMRRTTEFHVRGAWEDYLGTFGALQGAASTRIADELEQMDMLAA